MSSTNACTHCNAAGAPGCLDTPCSATRHRLHIGWARDSLDTRPTCVASLPGESSSERIPMNNRLQSNALLKMRWQRLFGALCLVATLALLAGCGSPGATPTATADPMENSTEDNTDVVTAPDAGATPETIDESSPNSQESPAAGGTIPPIDDSLATLEETVLQLFAESLGGVFPTPVGDNGAVEFGLLRATTPASLPVTWLVHTTGLRDFSSGQPHRVNIYQQVGEHVVAEVARLNLNYEAFGSSGVGEPDYLGTNSVHQVAIDPNLLFFSVEGGIGTHGGVYDLLRFDPNTNTLDVAFVASSDSPGVASESDLNGDGVAEIVVDTSDAYVFCYACSVRLPQVALWRWDGSQIVQVQLSALQSDAAPELQAENDNLLALANAGLWKEVFAALPAAEELSASASGGDPDGQFAWNLRVLRLNADAKRAAAEDPSAPFPLLAHLFYGDFDAALNVMQQYAPDDLFATPSALVTNSVAEGWEETLANWIERTTAPALDVRPDLAAAWFVRGYGDWLVGHNAEARTSLRQAATLAPDNTFMQEAANLLDASSSREDAHLVALTPVEIRSGPGNSFSIVATLQPGQSRTISGRFGVAPDIWWQVVDEDDTTGWVHADDARVQAQNAEHLPAVVAPAQMAPVALQGRIFFSAASGGTTSIYEIGVGATSVPVLVVEQARQPAFHNDSNLLVFASERPDMLGLSGLDLASGERTRYTYNLEDSLPRWSTLGDRLIFSSTREGDRRPRIYTVSIYDNAAESIRLGTDADVNPVDGRILFKGCDGTGNRCGLWIMDSNGANATALTDVAADSRPRWSPDGNSALFMSDGRDGNWEIYQVQLADGSITRLTSDEGEDGLPVYSPDGDSFAWIAHRGGVWGIHIQTLANGVPVLIHRIGATYLDWLDQGMDWAP